MSQDAEHARAVLRDLTDEAVDDEVRLQAALRLLDADSEDMAGLVNDAFDEIHKRLDALEGRRRFRTRATA